MSDGVIRKWRPRLSAVVLLVLGIVLCLPFAGLLLFNFFTNQLVQQTEDSLLAQATILSATYAQIYDDAARGDARSATVAEPGDFAGVYPRLSIGSQAVLPPRPDAIAVTEPPKPIYAEIGLRLTEIATSSQRRTLAAYRLIDPVGTVIAGSAEVGLSLSHIDEVSRALSGETVSVARVRVRPAPEPILYSLSRGARVRVFVAMPVIVDSEVVGAVYINRSPNHIFRFLWGERQNLLKAALFVVAATALVGFVFWRFITRPVYALIEQTQSFGNGDRGWVPIRSYGTREIENLARSFQSLSERLQRQQDALKSYTAHVTHELKSPLTSVRGAAELLGEAEMSADQQQKFLDNIARESARMEELLASMRSYSLADQTTAKGACTLADVANIVRSEFPSLAVDICGGKRPLPIHQDSLLIILKHLIENAGQHGAKSVILEVSDADGGVQLAVKDDGNGISEGNQDKVMTPFFTTRRDQGGTGMGLNIVKSIVESAGAKLSLKPNAPGASFLITF